MVKRERYYLTIRRIGLDTQSCRRKRAGGGNGWYILVTPLPGNFITENILEKDGIWTGLLAINVGITYIVSVGVHATVERPFHEVGVFVIRRMVGDGGTEMMNYGEEGEVLLYDKEDRIGHAEL
ncbi:hypothetical protein TrCOL_g11224 [Triparma columacea]|uniref:Uncharacterized protein n=1 Tax=Triparma columacea TaxID=722753 RepID=A0A9W7GKE8_9STRA|nr:hypothetical protein TrCOL_g11224 [Triparma columacea]